MPVQPASAYASRAAIERALKAAAKAGITPAGFRIEPGGAIVVFEASSPPDELEIWRAGRQAADELEQWRASRRTNRRTNGAD